MNKLHQLVAQNLGSLIIIMLIQLLKHQDIFIMEIQKEILLAKIIHLQLNLQLFLKSLRKPKIIKLEGSKSKI